MFEDHLVSEDEQARHHETKNRRTVMGEGRNTPHRDEGKQPTSVALVTLTKTTHSPPAAALAYQLDGCTGRMVTSAELVLSRSLFTELLLGVLCLSCGWYVADLYVYL